MYITSLIVCCVLSYSMFASEQSILPPNPCLSTASFVDFEHSIIIQANDATAEHPLPLRSHNQYFYGSLAATTGILSTFCFTSAGFLLSHPDTPTHIIIGSTGVFGGILFGCITRKLIHQCKKINRHRFDPS